MVYFEEYVIIYYLMLIMSTQELAQSSDKYAEASLWRCSLVSSLCTVLCYKELARSQTDRQTCVCVCSTINEARQCLVAGSQQVNTDEQCQPFDSHGRGVELAIEFLCGNGRPGLSLRRRLSVKIMPSPLSVCMLPDCYGYQRSIALHINSACWCIIYP